MQVCQSLLIIVNLNEPMFKHVCTMSFAMSFSGANLPRQARGDGSLFEEPLRLEGTFF